LNYAFLIDNRRCIGCHACSVACKAEHEVPLGVARTWVKYVEKGEFPETRRSFTVTRCNHCDDAPCIEICPTTALFKRHDGIVDFDPRRCIGCKACMQGCPYDALYIDPQTETAAKCNFCAHRVEVGLEPPCVTVCPTQAIVAGDLDDKSSKLVQLTSRMPLQVRKPEKGTKPKVFYIEADAASLVPSAAPPASDYMWAQAPQAAALSVMPLTEDAGAPRRTYGVKEQHRNSWGWKVSAYLWTKSIAAGVFLVPALLSLHDPHRYLLRPGVSFMALVFLGVTGVLLVWDLRQPQRFLWTLTRPQWRSWLVRGAYVITAYGLLLTLHVALGVLARTPPRPLVMATMLAAAATALYTAFLFGQSKGRDLWQSPLLAPHLIVQAVAAGAALVAPSWLRLLLPINGLLIAAEVWGRHATEDARRAAHLIEADIRFSTGVLAIGHLLPLALLWLAPSFEAVAGSLALTGLLLWEHLYVQAPQRIPNA
jgi:Fe-S-cluster-containing dehydrogenase component/formate-dependent nitrite reductase membrane component NrfD